MNTNNREISIHIAGGRHNKKSVPFLSRYQQQAESFFIPRDSDGRTKGLNVFVIENYNQSDVKRAEFLRLSGEHSILEASIRSIYATDYKLGSEEFERSVARRIREVVDTPKWQSDYYVQRLIMLDELRGHMDVQVDSEFHSLEERKEISKKGVTMLKKQAQAENALFFGEIDLASDRYLPSLIIEADLMRRRHKSVSNLIESYDKVAHERGVPLRVIVNFGSGHVRGLVKTFEQSLSNLDPNITYSYDHGEFLSHRYDLLYQMEFNQEHKPSNREILIALLHQIFADSPLVENHPLHRAYSYSRAGAIIYPLLDKCSIQGINTLVRTAEEVDFEEALVQLTGIGIQREPLSGLPRAIRRSTRRISKLFYLKR